MPSTWTIGVVSDIHYASPAERARGNDYEWRAISNPALRLAVRLYRRYIWRRHPMGQNQLLDQFLENGNDFDYVVANGDYSCNSAFVGVSDDAACQSAAECLQRLRGRFAGKLKINFGDHELGKVSLFGGKGGMRLESWRRARDELGMESFWQFELENY